MNQDKPKKKRKVFWIYYFFIALPFFAYRVFFWEPKPYVEELPDWFNSVEQQVASLENVSNTLYSNDMSIEVGTVNVGTDFDKKRIILSLSGKKYSGKLRDNDALSYSYQDFSVNEQEMEFANIDNCIVWISTDPQESSVLISLKPERVGLGSEKRIFLYLDMDKNEFRRIVKEKESSMKIEEALYYSIFESNYSGILLVHDLW